MQIGLSHIITLTKKIHRKKELRAGCLFSFTDFANIQAVQFCINIIKFDKYFFTDVSIHFDVVSVSGTVI